MCSFDTGKKAPLIIKDNMVKNMQAGSVIYDLAAVQGNTAFTEADQIIEINGVKIMGEAHLNKLPISASTYAKIFIIF